MQWGPSWPVEEVTNEPFQRERDGVPSWATCPVQKSHRAWNRVHSRHNLGRPGVVSYRSSQEAIGPLLGELARAGKDHRHLGVADSQPTEHVRQPGTAARLSSKEIRVIPFDHYRRLR